MVLPYSFAIPCLIPNSFVIADSLFG